jgi:quercetin dioxygenase-like cupin family protein
MLGDIRIRMVEYSDDYMADHWCSKGHIIFCTEGEMETELQDGGKFILQKGMTYYVGDDSSSHRSASVNGCKLFIVD